jgi:hypothetical protein
MDQKIANALLVVSETYTNYQNGALSNQLNSGGVLGVGGRVDLSI